MKYKLYNEIKYDNSLAQILYNRGIEEEEIENWLKAGWNDINSWKAFGKQEMTEACLLLYDYIINNKKILIIVDCDADGFTSSAILINFLYHYYPKYTKEKVSYFLHSGKQHGLEDVPLSELIHEQTLIICPDSASNDYECHEYIVKKLFCQVLVLDHHEAPHKSKYAITINNQLSNYPNKDFSGAGVTWQFCRAYEELYLKKDDCYSNSLIDLVALGNLSDMMSFTSLETKAVISLGLKSIKNPFFYYMCEKNKFSIDKMGGINYMSIAFYVTPFINAIVRTGTAEEKDLVFKSFLQEYAFEKIESGKRGHKGELVPRVEEAVRIVTNVKARQTKLQDSTMKLLEEKIQFNGLLNNAIIILTCEPGEVEKNIAGLVANKIQAKYQHPTLVLTKIKTENDEEYYYRGSARNYSMSENQKMRELCESTGLIEYAQGHEGAFGFSIAASKLDDFIEKTNELYADIPQEPVYWVDFIWTKSQIDSNTILNIAESKDCWGQGVTEPYICIKDINLSTCQIQLLSPDKHPTIKIHLDNGIDIMKFKSSQEELDKFCKPNQVMTAICRCAKNEWAGNITAQLIIEDYVLKEEWIF